MAHRTEIVVHALRFDLQVHRSMALPQARSASETRPMDPWNALATIPSCKWKTPVLTCRASAVPRIDPFRAKHSYSSGSRYRPIGQLGQFVGLPVLCYSAASVTFIFVTCIMQNIISSGYTMVQRRKVSLESTLDSLTSLNARVWALPSAKRLAARRKTARSRSW